MTQGRNLVRDDRTFEQRVSATRQRFIDGLPARLESIDAALDAGADAASGESHARLIHRMLHDLAGNAAMLELDLVEESVRSGLKVAEAADSGDGSLSPDDIRAIHLAVAVAHEVARNLKTTAPT
tara:strand:+ start:94 stop:468 length:375 start_codon:yes stop_codon:yes gene_type:complete